METTLKFFSLAITSLNQNKENENEMVQDLSHIATQCDFPAYSQYQSPSNIYSRRQKHCKNINSVFDSNRSPKRASHLSYYESRIKKNEDKETCITPSLPNINLSPSKRSVSPILSQRKSVFSNPRSSILPPISFKKPSQLHAKVSNIIDSQLLIPTPKKLHSLSPKLSKFYLTKFLSKNKKSIDCQL